MNINKYLLSFAFVFLSALLSINSNLFANPPSCIINGPVNVCENSTSVYTISVAGSNTYYWNAIGGGTVIGIGSSVSVAWTTPGTGTLSVIVKDSLLNVVCTATLNVIIHMNPKPVITPSFISGCGDIKSDPGQHEKDNCFTACDSTWIKYSTPLHTGSTYVWTVTGSANFTSSGNQLNVYWTNTGGGIVHVKETDAYGCVGETEICITIVGKPIAAFTTMPGLTGFVVNACKGQPIQFFDNSVAGTGSPINSWSWYFGDGGTAFFNAPGSANTSYSYNTPGNYTVMLVVENKCHCKDTAYVNVVVSDNPGPDIFCISTVCPGNTVTYHTNVHCGNYNWSVTNGTPIGSSTDSVFTVQWGSNGPGIVSLSTNCTGFCPATTSVLVPIIPPNATINGPTLVCQNNCYTYHISCDIPLDSIRWHFPAGVTVTTDSINVHEVNVCFYGSNISGNITVDYFHNIPGSTTEMSCGGHSTIHVTEKPQMFLSGGTNVCQNQPFTYNIFPAPTGSIYWTITNMSGNTTYTSNTIIGPLPFTGLWSYGAGTFIVTANDLSGNYCNGPQKLTITVNPIPPQLDSIVGPDPVCPNQSYTYLAMGISSAYSVGWQITNGTPATGAGNSLSVTWGPTGPYVIKAIRIDPVTGCKSSAITKTINSLLPLGPSNIIGPITVCANSDVNYSTTSPGDDFEWSINSSLAGSIKTGQHTQNIVVQWNNYTGTAWLVLKRFACNSFRKDSVLITINYPPVPPITPPSTICQGVSKTFSSSGAISYSWNFGDGNTSSGSPVNHSYNVAGNYVVTLTATYSGLCPGSAINTTNITVYPNPNINISTPDPNLFCNPPVLTNMFVSAPVLGTTYQWYNPALIPLATGTSYTATATGSYYVIGTNSYGCSATSNVIPVSTGVCPPGCNVAPYTLNFNRTRTGCNTDNFTANFSPGVINPSWNFDDPFNPSTATGINASHTFTEPGYYRVTLCADAPNASGTGYCNVCITINDTINYVPDFFTLNTCANFSDSVNVQFINTTKRISTLPIPAWSWSVTPGVHTSTLQNPAWNFFPGTYTANLTVAGICTITKTFIIQPLPSASFSVADSFCVNKPVIFLNTSTGAFTGSSWNFGDASSSLITSPIRNYSLPGTYLVTLQIANNLGCLDTAKQVVTVLPNTLAGLITASGPTYFCEGDSVNLICNPSGGYPAYQFLWTTTQTTQNIYALQTGSYGVQLTDSKGCFLNVPPKNVIVKSKPKPVITGPATLCFNNYYIYSVNYPALPGAVIEWWLDGILQTTGTSYGFYTGSSTIGNHIIVVNVLSPDTCSGSDTLHVVIHPNPNVSIITTGALCEGSNNMLVASFTSPNIQSLYWNNGLTNDTIYSGIPGNYTVNVVDSNGCKAQASTVINPLPDLCGLMTGCYEICDTIKQLVWSAPAGYASYQWYYNGNPITASTSDTIHIPLYQSGHYSVLITSAAGCKVMSDIIDITFVKCGGCDLNAHATVLCGPVTSDGYPTYLLTFTVNNTLAAGAGISINSSQGIITSLTPSTLVPGNNTVNATFIDTPPSGNLACFSIVIFDKEQRCDTTICIKLPDCGGDCSEKVSVKKFDCAGFDNFGNPQYYMCLDVYWGGSNGSTLMLNTSSGSFTPNPVTVNNGNQTVCLTFTDLPPHSGFFKLYTYFFDPLKEKLCKDSLNYEFKPCDDFCNLSTYGECADCRKKVGGNWTYDIDITVFNPYGINANLTILPITAGTFSPITPNPIAPGMQFVHTIFTDLAPANSIICFRVVLTNPLTNQTCWKDICLALPRCYHRIIGVLSYDNPVGTAIGNTPITLTDLGGVTINTDTTDASGGFVFEDVTDGSYKIVPKISKKWGGSNSTDALLINRFFVKLYTFSDLLKKQAGDVNSDKNINPTDGLYISKRFVNLINSFKSGDWIYERDTIVVEGNDVEYNVKAICVGDVNGSFTPNTKKYNDIMLGYSGEINVKNIKGFEIPLSITKDVELGAISLKFKSQKSDFKILDVVSNIDGLLYNIVDGAVEIAWSATDEPLRLKAGQVILNLKIQNSDVKSDIFTLTPECELADINGKILTGELLSMPKLVFNAESIFSHSCYPNPFNKQTTISFTLAEPSFVNLKICDLLGNEVKTLLNANIEKGNTKVDFDASDLTSGIYFYKIQAGSQSSFGKMILLK